MNLISNGAEAMPEGGRIFRDRPDKRGPELGAGPYIKKPYTLEKISFAIRQEIQGVLGCQ